MKTLELADYKIYVGTIRDALNDFLNEHSFSKVAVLVDENTRKDCLPIFRTHTAVKELAVIEIPSGEVNKTIATCESVWQQMMNLSMDRHSLMINLGGGVIGDMGGFCAATFKRGMAFIQIPTTLLAQVDASIGGKLGVDFNRVKNAVGLFKNPNAVFIDPVFLATLPYEELRSGFAEIIKHGLIADKALWSELRQEVNLNNFDMSELVYRSLLVKQQVVEQDPFEKGLRKILNFGHTVGHAVESHSMTGSNPLLHGEAIAVGMVCEAYLSHTKGQLDMDAVQTISQHILHVYEHVRLPETDYTALINIMRQDKKNLGDTINFTFLTAPGHSQYDQTCTAEQIVESLNYYNGLKN